MGVLNLSISAILAMTTNLAFAGSLTNGEWTPSSCGNKPVTPVVNGQSAESYNDSVKVINEWQQLANTYYGCIVSEANKDNAVIVQRANQEQNNFKQEFEGVSAAIDAAKKKLEGK